MKTLFVALLITTAMFSSPQVSRSESVPSQPPLHAFKEMENKVADIKPVRVTPAIPRGTPECEKWDREIDRQSNSLLENTWAKRVMRCESRCNEGAYNESSGASGLFQIIPKWHPTMVGKVFDGYESIKYALYKYRLGGAGIWVCK